MRLRNSLEYDPETGVLVWAKPDSDPDSRRNGVKAGSLSRDGYLVIFHKRKLWKAHRLIWEELYGPIPFGLVVDHINRDRADNRLMNLRLLSNGDNQTNSYCARRQNQTGIRGVSALRKGARFRARITAFGHTQDLGCFRTEEEAEQAYLQAKEHLHTKAEI